jgi:hypothetical protein
MKLHLAVLLTTSILSLTASAEPLPAPELPRLRNGLPRAVETPSDVCRDKPGVWLPAELAEAVDLQRERCRQLPAICAKTLEIQDDLCQAEKAAIERIANQRGRAEVVGEYSGASWRDKLLWGLGGCIVGAAAVTALLLGLRAGG